MCLQALQGILWMSGVCSVVVQGRHTPYLLPSHCGIDYALPVDVGHLAGGGTTGTAGWGEVRSEWLLRAF